MQVKFLLGGGLEPPCGSGASDLLLDDVCVLKGWVGLKEVLDGMLCPFPGCAIKLPCASVLGGGLCFDACPQSPWAPCKAPLVTPLEESLDVVFMCVGCLPFFPFNFDVGEGVVPVNGCCKDALLAAAAEDVIRGILAAEGALHPDEPCDRSVGASVFLLPSPCVVDGVGDVGWQCGRPIAKCFAGALSRCGLQFLADVLLVKGDAENLRVCGCGLDGLGRAA